MKTEDLIAALAADTTPRPPVARDLGRAMLLAAAVTLAAFLAYWGPRPDLWAALGSAAVLKTLVPLGLGALAAALALALAHPGAAPGRLAAMLGAAGLALALSFGLALARDGLGGLIDALSTPSLVTCLSSIPALAVPLLVAVFRGLSAGASTRPRQSGAAAGLLAGALSAAVYSIYCDKDVALFVLPAYATAIATVALIGALLGPRLLRW